ncbi:MAG TPA: SUMF1/EgtB/PvdO family nonheme iron enzyme [Planctomycetota bacterium]|nr:SUMF1/EgtB/PvdO family nonheme iron enzyme [Planctomycetota bacterium]
MKDEIKRIQEYVWARHIDGSDHYDHSIDEETAIRVLDAYYSEIGNRNSPDQLYLGILLFERAFEHPEQQAELFERARKILEFYRRVSQETDWPAVEDRLDDIRRYQEDQAPPAPPEAPEAEEPPAPAAPPAAPPQAPAPVAAVEPAPAPVAAVAVAEGEAAEAPAATQDKDARREAREAIIADLPVVAGMVLVPAGSFLYGPDGKEVFLDMFYIDRSPVTNTEYERFVRETGYRPPRYAADPRLNEPEQPVTGVSYADAAQFARWAGKELPTEQQWEKAARGTDGRVYPWGNDPPGTSDAAFGQDPETGSPRSVGSWPRNVSPFGAQDMCGNVWEWTSSRYKKDSEFQVVRGGCYNDPVEYLHVYYRLEAHPKDKCEAIGFRCVKNVH